MAPSSPAATTNNSLFWIPQTATNGGSWYNPRRDYHNDTRLDLLTEGVVDIQVAYDVFSSSNFFAKVGLTPEYVPNEIRDTLASTALYVEVTYRLAGETNAGNLAFTAWQHTGPGARTGLATNDSMSFVPGQIVSFQMSTNWCQVYYGTNLLISQTHGIGNIAGLYAHGAYPHLELQNRGASTNVTANIGEVVCRQRSGFGVP